MEWPQYGDPVLPHFDQALMSSQTCNLPNYYDYVDDRVTHFLRYHSSWTNHKCEFTYLVLYNPLLND